MSTKPSRSALALVRLVKSVLLYTGGLRVLSLFFLINALKSHREGIPPFVIPY